MATHSSILAWQIPWKVETGGLQSMRSQSQTGLKQLNTRLCGEQLRATEESSLIFIGIIEEDILKPFL